MYTIEINQRLDALLTVIAKTSNLSVEECLEEFITEAVLSKTQVLENKSYSISAFIFQHLQKAASQINMEVNDYVNRLLENHYLSHSDPKESKKTFDPETGRSILRSTRRTLDLTQTQLSEMTGIPRGTIAKFETGRSILTETRLNILKKCLQIDISGIETKKTKNRSTDLFVHESNSKDKDSDPIQPYQESQIERLAIALNLNTKSIHSLSELLFNKKFPETKKEGNVLMKKLKNKLREYKHGKAY